jgi:hypothetical protein
VIPAIPAAADRTNRGEDGGKVLEKGGEILLLFPLQMVTAGDSFRGCRYGTQFLGIGPVFFVQETGKPAYSLFTDPRGNKSPLPAQFFVVRTGSQKEYRYPGVEGFKGGKPEMSNQEVVFGEFFPEFSGFF